MTEWLAGDSTPEAHAAARYLAELAQKHMWFLKGHEKK